MEETDWMKVLSQLSDALMLLNYVLDPVLYVLMRQRQHASVGSLCHSIADCFKRNHKTSTESMKTSCCPQETVLVSDSSGAEMRPLRPPVCLKLGD
ncbi:jg15147 [Pararge aegeria aegeria]|uniref:Jg15147 protein n=2 Tax=Pararge aegeria TaxID=116150 RepID=A0A8S4RXV6_9NEOP|nr:jg15147 [Pararge aegeria aegeria]